MSEAETLANFKMDKTDWPSGPWMDEPDRLQWRTAAGLPGLIVRNHMGVLCGYAAVAPGHPLHGKGYDDVDVDAHGGLTYANRCQDDGPICHVPEPGEPDNVWWFGFDCNHAWDFAPGMSAILPAGFLRHRFPDEVYRDLAYVKAEVESLAVQLAEKAT